MADKGLDQCARSAEDRLHEALEEINMTKYLSQPS